MDDFLVNFLLISLHHSFVHDFAEKYSYSAQKTIKIHPKIQDEIYRYDAPNKREIDLNSSFKEYHSPIGSGLSLKLSNTPHTVRNFIRDLKESYNKGLLSLSPWFVENGIQY